MSEGWYTNVYAHRRHMVYEGKSPQRTLRLFAAIHGCGIIYLLQEIIGGDYYER